jgi:hypothetical protein
MIVFELFLPQMMNIEHPSFLATDFSNENQYVWRAVPPVSMREKRALAHLCHKTGRRAGS